MEDRTRLLLAPDVDLESDVYPLAHMLPGDVVALARLLKVPEPILGKPLVSPVADGPGGGFKGDEVERLLQALVVEGLDAEGAERRTSVPLERIRWLQRRIQSNRHRCEGLRVPSL